MSKVLHDTINALINKDQVAAAELLKQHMAVKAKEIVAKTLSEGTVDNTDSEEKSVPIETVKKGTYVKKKADSKKFYKAAGFDNSSKKYLLDDEDDISRQISVKKGTMVFVGFEY